MSGPEWRATPDDAYAYAKGQTIKHAMGFDLRLTDGPLDFLAVTDHAEYLGVLQAIDTPSAKTVVARAMREPLLQFLTIALVLFITNQLIHGDVVRPSGERITISQGRVQRSDVARSDCWRHIGVICDGPRRLLVLFCSFQRQLERGDDFFLCDLRIRGTSHVTGKQKGHRFADERVVSCSPRWQCPHRQRICTRITSVLFPLSSTSR